MYRTLAEWLQWQETLHPETIELGLERVSAVAKDLGPGKPAGTVITVAGTNGKGSSIAMLESIYHAAGYSTAAYTSPHLQHYNERLRLDLTEVSDDALCAAFARVDRARGETSLTYFEFGTLAVLDIMRRCSADVALLEVGLGGRLDAVNIIDPDLALVTNVGLDHQQWLGDTREAIGAEKAGIFRSGVPAVFGQREVPHSVREHAQQLQTTLYSPGNGFDRCDAHDGWEFSAANGDSIQLPLPSLPGEHQLANAAAVVQAVRLLSSRLPVSDIALCDGLRTAVLPGRMQTLAGPVPLLLDVAHNPDAAEALAAQLKQTSVSGHTRAVVGVLADKDLAGLFTPLLPLVDCWYCAGLPSTPRGLAGVDLEAMLGTLAAPGALQSQCYPDPGGALEAALSASVSGDRVVVFGSFFTVAAVQAALEELR